MDFVRVNSSDLSDGTYCLKMGASLLYRTTKE